MSIFSLAPKPPSLLGYHRILSPSAGVKVSPLCLGTMNFGTAWYDNLHSIRSIGIQELTHCRKDYMGECGKEQSFAILDAFYNLGGNFLDTLVVFRRVLSGC